MSSTAGERAGLRRPWARSERTVPRTIVRPLQEFMAWEAASALVLLAATAAALLWANLGSSYEDLWSTVVSVDAGSLGLDESLRDIVNDGLMALFFLVIGLEVKRELVVGELRERRAAMLPLCAALGGMVVPALVYLAVTAGRTGAGGWGMVMATDIAFALGVLALLARRVPGPLSAFLLGLAVIDDIGSIVVIALVYSDGISVGWLLAAVAGLGLIAVLRRQQVRHLAAYVVIGLAVWLATLESGVHATIAGVALGLLTPARPFQRPVAVSAEAYRIADETVDEPDDPDADAAAWRSLSTLSREAISPLARVEHALHPWTSFVVLPVFALANAGIVLDTGTIDAATHSAVTLAVVLGLVAGKTIGVPAGALLATRLGLARLPDGVRRLHLLGVGGVAGIGFTVSLFIATLAFEDPGVLASAKIGILAASLIAAGLGTAILLAAGRRAPA